MNSPHGCRTLDPHTTGEPVAFSYLAHIPDQPIVLMYGAGTLNEYRGKGVYTSLVARRLADAHADGAEAAIIQAGYETSEPICSKLGFREVCSLELYEWIPTEPIRQERLAGRLKLRIQKHC